MRVFRPPDVLSYLRDTVDADRDGFLDDNEFRTLAALVLGKAPRAIDITELKNCTLNYTYPDLQQLQQQSTQSFTTSSSSDTEGKGGGVKVTVQEILSAFPMPSLQQAMDCEQVPRSLIKHVHWQQSHVTGPDKEVSFEMVGDNYTISTDQLDSVRARKTKFICINDNMKAPSVELEKSLRAFYESFFPFTSQFELKGEGRNSVLHTDKYFELLASQSSFFSGGGGGGVIGQVRHLYESIVAGVKHAAVSAAYHTLHRLDRESAASVSFEQRYAARYVRTGPAGVSVFLPVSTLVVVAALVAILLIRRCILSRAAAAAATAPSLPTNGSNNSRRVNSNKNSLHFSTHDSDDDNDDDEEEYDNSDEDDFVVHGLNSNIDEAAAEAYLLGDSMDGDDNDTSPSNKSDSGDPRHRHHGLENKSEDFLNALWRENKATGSASGSGGSGSANSSASNFYSKKINSFIKWSDSSTASASTTAGNSGGRIPSDEVFDDHDKHEQHTASRTHTSATGPSGSGAIVTSHRRPVSPPLRSGMRGTGAAAVMVDSGGR